MEGMDWNNELTNGSGAKEWDPVILERAPVDLKRPRVNNESSVNRMVC
jgi:hypothetical protein